MDSVDLQVLKSAATWLEQGHGVVLATVVETWGSAPRPAGALLAVRDDGQVAGSVSGGCVEDDLIDRIRRQDLAGDKPELTVYGISKEEAARFGLPCGGQLRIVLEPLRDAVWLTELLSRVANRELVARELNLITGEVRLRAASRSDSMSFKENMLRTIHGPHWRLLVIGAGQSGVRVDERLLHRVLAAGLGQDPAAVAHERPAVAIDDHVERALVSGAHELHEPLVGLHGKDRAARETGRRFPAGIRYQRGHGVCIG